MDESNIVQLLEHGSHREAFEEIAALYQDKVFHLALSLMRREAAALDMTQEAFLRLWKALPAYDRRASISTWLYAIARNVCFTELKRCARRGTVSLDDPAAALPPDETAGDGSTPGAGLDVETVLAALPENYQRVLRLFYLEQRSCEETAQMLGIPAGTVKTLLFRARKEAARLSKIRGARPQPLPEMQT